MCAIVDRDIDVKICMQLPGLPGGLFYVCIELCFYLSMAFQRFSYLFDWVQMRPDSTAIRAHIMQHYLGQFYPSIEDEYMSRAEQSIQATDEKGPREQPQSLITEELIYNPQAFQSQNPKNDWLPVSTQSLTNNPSTARLGSHAANEDGSSNGSESIEASLNQSFTRQGDSVIGTNHQPQPEINPLQLRDNSAESGMKTEPAVEAQGSTLKAKPDQRSGTGQVSQTLRRITEQSALSLSPSSPQKSDSHLLGTLTDNLNSYLIIKNNKIAIEGVALSNTNQLVSDLMAIGLEDASVYGNSFTGMMPLSSLSQLEAQKKLGYVRAVLKPATNSDSDQAVLNSGLAISEGDKAQRSDVARLKYGTSGNGVTVGVLSDSFNARNEASADIVSGDLPQSGVKVLRDIADGSDEGRAMLQIIHDVAPGANLAFHTAFLGQVSFALGIKNLANPLTQGGAGARVIVDDVIYFAEPFFQDGIIAQAVNEVASDGNVSYFSSAGNRADKSYEASWNPGRTQSGYSWHDFNPGTQQADFLQDITVLPGREFTIVFQWDEPFASASITGKGSANDLDIFFFASNDPNFGSQDPDFDSLFSNNLITESIDANINGDPFEFISVRNNGDVVATGYLAVGQFLGIGGGGPAPGRIKYVDFGIRSSVVEYATNSSTSFGHNQAALGLGVAAADYRNTPEFGVNPP